eukprot:394100-Lingulodinium_polyedra.AAC.1
MPVTCSAGVAGAVLLAQAAESRPALWPTDGPNWVPPPRAVPDGEATASWGHVRCSACREHRRLPVAVADYAAGMEVTVPVGTEGNL